MGDPVVETAYGKVVGTRVGAIQVFRGVPYGSCTGPGAVPAGVDADAVDGPAARGRLRRHRPPGADGPLQGDAGRVPRAGVRSSRQPGPGRGVPGAQRVDARPRRRCRPVMVWLHSAPWNSGVGSGHDGAPLAASGDVVVVTLNHRLGVLGFLHLDGVAPGEYPNSGVMGMLDVVTALEWVRDHIAAFGGDPGNVMVFGESGGGMKTTTLLAMPDARGLFHKAAIESGPYLRGVPAERASRFTNQFLAELELLPADVGQPDTLPVERLIEAQERALRGRGPDGGRGAAPGRSPSIRGGRGERRNALGNRAGRRRYRPAAPSVRSGGPGVLGRCPTHHRQQPGRSVDLAHALPEHRAGDDERLRGDRGRDSRRCRGAGRRPLPAHVSRRVGQRAHRRSRVHRHDVDRPCAYRRAQGGRRRRARLHVPVRLRQRHPRRPVPRRVRGADPLCVRLGDAERDDGEPSRTTRPGAGDEHRGGSASPAPATRTTTACPRGGRTRASTASGWSSTSTSAWNPSPACSARAWRPWASSSCTRSAPDVAPVLSSPADGPYCSCDVFHTTEEQGIR